MDLKFKLKIYPITEDGEEIFTGALLDVISINFVTKAITARAEYISPLVGLRDMLLGGRLDTWHYGDNRDGRDKQSELYFTINDGNLIKYED